MKLNSIKTVLLIALSALGLSANAAARAAKSYTCTAFNPVSGYARITYGKKEGERKSRAEIHYGFLVSEVEGGVLSYDPDTVVDLPRAVFSTKVNGVEVPFHMDLFRPWDNETKEVILSGVTYVPAFALAANLPLFARYSGSLEQLDGKVAVPAGFTPTSVVTCRVFFR